MNPLRIYDYLMMTRERVFDAVRALTSEQYQHQFAIGLKTIGATLTHIMISEWYYIERLQGRTMPPYEQWPIKYERPPLFDVIEPTWREQAKATRAAVTAERNWNRRITWLSFPNDEGKRFHITCTAGDLFTQLALHEVHHRAQIMAMLRLLASEGAAAIVEDIDYNALMYQRVEAT